MKTEEGITDKGREDPEKEQITKKQRTRGRKDEQKILTKERKNNKRERGTEGELDMKLYNSLSLFVYIYIHICIDKYMPRTVSLINN